MFNIPYLCLCLSHGGKEQVFLTMDNDELMKAKDELQKNKYDESNVPVERSCPIFAVSEACYFQLLVGRASGLDVRVCVCMMLVVEVFKCMLRKFNIGQGSEKGREHQGEVKQVEQKETPSLLVHIGNTCAKQRPSGCGISVPAVGKEVLDHTNRRYGEARSSSMFSGSERMLSSWCWWSHRVPDQIAY